MFLLASCFKSSDCALISCQTRSPDETRHAYYYIEITLYYVRTAGNSCIDKGYFFSAPGRNF